LNVAAQRRIPEKKHQELIGKLLGDVGGAMSGALVLVGDKLDFHRTLAEESRGAHLNRSALRA
jgi:hypothetical protein